jgi:RNA polymerase sigma-70 factor (ECF subfamily)
MAMPPKEADADVHLRLRAGDYRGALELLLPRYKDRAFRLAVSILRNRSEAEDVCQDIFFRLWTALPEYSGRASLSTWIYAITRNACLSQIRKRRPQVSLDAVDIQHDPAMAAPIVDDSAVQSALRLVEMLPARYREVVTLFYMEDKSCEQTASALDLPVGTVKALLHRARRRMIQIAGSQAGG